MTATDVVEIDSLQVSFDAQIAPVARVDADTVVRFTTADETFRRMARGETLTEAEYATANAVAGPLWVNGAEPGDALRVEILDIEIASAWVAWLQEFGPLGSLVDGTDVRQVEVLDGRVALGEGISVALDPMIGCVGVAPANGRASTMRPVYRTGGNLDLRELRPRAVIWLPVEVEGALLSVGDLHAAMGQGEPAFVAIEAAGSATVRVGLDKQKPLPGPRVRIEGATVCVGLGESFPMARRSAVQQAYELLHDDHGLAPRTAYAYLCASVSLMPAGPSGSMVDGGLEAVVAVVPDPR